MEHFADSPQFMKRRFHMAPAQLSHLQHASTCQCIKCIKFARSVPKLGLDIATDDGTVFPQPAFGAGPPAPKAKPKPAAEGAEGADGAAAGGVPGEGAAAGGAGAPGADPSINKANVTNATLPPDGLQISPEDSQPHADVPQLPIPSMGATSSGDFAATQSGMMTLMIDGGTSQSGFKSSGEWGSKGRMGRTKEPDYFYDYLTMIEAQILEKRK